MSFKTKGVRITLREADPANVTYAGGDPRRVAQVPAAVDAALHGHLALLERLVTAQRFGDARGFPGTATACHDYPRPYDLSAPPAERRAEYNRALAALDRRQFRPFSPTAWLATNIDAGPKCLDWPADPTAGSPLHGLPRPDVPVLAQSGDLDTNTPIEQGRRDRLRQAPHHRHRTAPPRAVTGCWTKVDG